MTVASRRIAAIALVAWTVSGIHQVWRAPLAWLDLSAAEQGTTRTSSKRPRLFPPEDLGLLEAPDRDDWNKPDLIMDALGIADGGVVADLGAGGGWFTIRLARRVGPNGIVYAEDIQPLMIEAMNR